MKKIFFTLLIIFFIPTSFTIAEENEGFVEQFFKELDMNKDGVITKQDIQKYSKKEFELMDTDKNGKVSQNEFFIFVCKKSCTQDNCDCDINSDFSYITEYYYRVDSNNDGEITYQEKLDSDTEDFYNFDLNHDGKITKDEVEAQLY